MATQNHIIGKRVFKVKEVVEVHEHTGEKWLARILGFKKDSGHVIVRDLRRSKFQGTIWRDEKLIHKATIETPSQRLQTY